MTHEKINATVKQAIAILHHGGVIVYPTETVYGIGCDPFNEAACTRIRTIKGRDGDKPFLLLAAGIEQIEPYTGQLSGDALQLAHEFWPGPLTLVLRVHGNFPRWLTGPTGGVAFRITPHPLAADLVAGFGAPIVSTSANLTGQSPAASYHDALAQFKDSTEFVLDNPAIMRGVPSTIVDLTDARLVIIREGEISRKTIEEVLKR